MKIFALVLVLSLIPTLALAELTPDQRENLDKNIKVLIDEEMQSEAIGMAADAYLDAQGDCGLSQRKCLERMREQVAKILRDEGELPADAQAQITDIDQKLGRPAAEQNKADNLKPAIEAAQYVLNTGDTELTGWDKLSEFGRLGQTLKFQVHQLYQPGPLLILASGLGTWFSLKEQKTINQSVYNEFHGNVTIPQGIVTAGQWAPFAAVGAVAPVYFIALKTNNEGLRDFSEAASVAIAEDAGASSLLKILFHDCRPGTPCLYKNGNPSEHASIVFAIATVVDAKFGHKWGAFAYVLASSVVFTRLVNHDPANVHNLGQGIDGAATGYYFGKTAWEGQQAAKNAHSSRLGKALSHCQPLLGPGIAAGSCGWQLGH